MLADKFGRTAEQAKADQRVLLERARNAYPEWVDTQGEYVKGSANTHDLHLLADRGLIERVPGRAARTPVGFEDTTRTNVTILQELRQEIERAPIEPKERGAGLLDAVAKLARHPVVLAILKKLLRIGYRPDRGGNYGGNRRRKQTWLSVNMRLPGRNAIPPLPPNNSFRSARRASTGRP